MFAALRVAIADTALHSVHGYTATPSGLHEFSVLVFADDGKIVATGDASLLAAYPQAEHIDGSGRFVLPGLIDAHAHVYGLGFLATSIDLGGTPSVESAVESIANYARSNPHAEWIRGRGWNQVLWPGQQYPTAADLDAISTDRRIWLRRIDGHAGWANSKTMQIAGINDDTPDPIGGKILRDSDGHATGIFVDEAMTLVESHIPPASKDDIRDAYTKAIARLLSLGITSVHDAGITVREAEVYLSMADDGELGIRVYAMLSGAGENLDAIGKPVTAYGNDRLDIRSVKLYADGALGSRGAALLEPYSDDVENRGLLLHTADALHTFVEKANGLGFQVGIHAIGDRGNRIALNAFARAQDSVPSPLRNRIEHAQIVAPTDIPRFAELGIIASMQPTHATSDMNMAEDRVGPERIKGGYAWRRLLDSGAIIASGSDFPVELANPFHGLSAAVTRTGRDGLPRGGWYADQALSRYDALRSFTLDAAYAAHAEKRLGSLEPGKWADFIIVDRDYFAVDAEQIAKIRVLETWVGGKHMYDAEKETQQ